MTTPENGPEDAREPVDEATNARIAALVASFDERSKMVADAEAAEEQANAAEASPEADAEQAAATDVVAEDAAGAAEVSTEAEATTVSQPAATDAVAEDAAGVAEASSEVELSEAAVPDSAAPTSADTDPDAPNAILGAPPEAEAADSEDTAEDTAFASRLPDLTEDEALHSALEALLLVVDSPAEVEALADALDEPVKRIRAALKTMAAHYQEQNRGIDLRDAGGGWRFYTRDKYAPFVEKLLHEGQRAKLTRAALESLAVIAYRQPVTRARVAAVRGVNVDGVIRTLLARGLIEETGTDKDTGGILYRTTELFLERLGLSSLEDLPPIAPLLPEVDAIDDV